MNEYELLVRHTTAWAQAKNRTMDAELLGHLLSLRDSQDLRPGTSWPIGSVEHLLTIRWPGHGPLGVPDDTQVATMIETLDTFWRFLRGTGRMASGSAEPRELVKEARRAAPEMQRRCGDPAAYGQAKSLQSFGEEIGLSLEGAESMEQIQERLQAITDAWKALPIAERQARMPVPGSAGSRAAEEMSRLFAEAVAELPDEQEAIPVQDPAVVARQVRASRFVAQCQRLASWAVGRELTAAGLLRPAVAREAIAELGLGDWYAAAFGRAENTWRSAGDCLTLDRLWLPATEAGLVDATGSRARVGTRAPQTDEEWVALGLLMLVQLHHRVRSEPFATSPLVGVLLHLAHPDGAGSVTEAELVEWWRSAPPNPFGAQHVRGLRLPRGEFDDRLVEVGDAMLRSCLAVFDDTGIWRRHGNRLVRTELGVDFTRVLIGVLEWEDAGSPL